ncbi:MAG: serine/threonine protein kinase, partial [Holophaga sp.]|nr:serine/threonine protein kinase [Holophaga sp.]
MDFVDPAAIGRYTVLERLGAGAMGVVYLAQDPLLKRRVAVKIVQKTRSDSETMIARFQRESEISAQLNHANIITVFDVGEDPEAGPFLTMEYVDGSSLSRILSERTLDPETALEWLTQLGQALVAAERAGVVHRDIKPENILVSRDSQLKLTDFGLARDDDSSLTHTGTMMGTPTHTAPELLGGDRATPATDRWAFSVMAFQMVLGTLLWIYDGRYRVGSRDEAVAVAKTFLGTILILQLASLLFGGGRLLALSIPLAGGLGALLIASAARLIWRS